MTVAAVLFDKDGTLVDFHQTWGLAVGTALRASSRNDADLARAAELLEYDLVADRMAPSSPFVAETADTVNELIESHVDLTVFASTLKEASGIRLRPAEGAQRFLDQLAGHRVPCAVVTNDSERGGRRQMEALGWLDRFVAVLGADSGFGGKPEPGMVIEACRRMDADPARSWMVGDSILDVLAGERAGCRTVLLTNREEVPISAVERADLVVETLADLTVDVLEDAGPSTA